MIDPRRASRCERVRIRAALAPDGELLPLELRLLEAHLARCADCRAFAEDVAAIADRLRAAGAAPGHRVALPAERARSVVAAAMVAVAAFGIALRAPVPAGTDGVSERVATPVATVAAEARTVRQLRREALLTPLPYPDRPTRSFGDRPAKPS